MPSPCPAVEPLPPPSLSSPLSHLTGPARTGSRRILLVEDEPLQARALTLALRDYGLELHTASSGEAALQLIAREPPYLAIITDLRLPGLSGQELASRMRASRLIALSGDVHALHRLRHFDARLRKPCPLDVLLAAALGPGPDDPGGPLGHA